MYSGTGSPSHLPPDLVDQAVDVAARRLALRLLGSEAAQDGVDPAARRAVEKLGAVLARLTGDAGWQALLTRALVLARDEVRWLTAVTLAPDGTLVGFPELARRQDVAAGAETLLATLLALLHTFIDDALALHLVQSVWPEAPLAEAPDAEETR